MIKIYGIPNCDSCRNARKWLEQHDVLHEFHDIRADGLELQAIHRWANRVGWQKLLNTRSQTWRQVAQEVRDNIDEGSALALMFEQPTLIKRPVFEDRDLIIVGFDKDIYAEAIRR